MMQGRHSGSLVRRPAFRTVLAGVAILALALGGGPSAWAQRQADERYGDEGGLRALGIEVGPSRGAGVRVERVQPQSAADRAGLREGDYILSVEGEDIDSPRELQQELDAKEPGERIELGIWREGREQTLRVAPAERREAEFRRHPPRDLNGREPAVHRPAREPHLRQRDQAWLGIQLKEAEDEDGVEITRVYPAGPAARAGLSEGDVIVEIDGQRVTRVEEASEIITRKQPREQLRLTLLRDDEEEEFTAMLASRADFLDEDHHAHFDEPGHPDGVTMNGYPLHGDFERDPHHAFHDDDVPEHMMILEHHRRLSEQHQRIEHFIMELREEIRELREEIRQMQNGPAERRDRRRG